MKSSVSVCAAGSFACPARAQRPLEQCERIQHILCALKPLHQHSAASVMASERSSSLRLVLSRCQTALGAPGSGRVAAGLPIDTSSFPSSYTSSPQMVVLRAPDQNDPSGCTSYRLKARLPCRWDRAHCSFRPSKIHPYACIHSPAQPAKHEFQALKAPRACLRGRSAKRHHLLWAGAPAQLRRGAATCWQHVWRPSQRQFSEATGFLGVWNPFVPWTARVGPAMVMGAEAWTSTGHDMVSPRRTYVVVKRVRSGSLKHHHSH
eukprot:362009-Chlamydomonas_euryale.AAC.15